MEIDALGVEGLFYERHNKAWCIGMCALMHEETRAWLCLQENH